MAKLHPDFLSKPLAHRGLHGAGIPENSRAAFEAAIAAGYGIELDLQLSNDHEAMVFHDYDMTRLTGVSGPIQMQSVENLASRPLKNDEPIPALPEILDLVAGRAPLLIELKDQDGALGPNVGILEKRTAEILRTYTGPVAVMSFNPHSTLAMKSLLPDVARGLVTERFLKSDWAVVPQARLDEVSEIPDFEACDAGFISHNHKQLSMKRVAEIKESGANILCWTIKSQADADAALQIADNITFEGYHP